MATLRPNMAGRWCLFAKPPEPGRSKTRLAAGVGALRAAELAAAFLTDTVASLASVARPGEAVVLATTEVDGDFPAITAPLPRWSQGEGDLGARMGTVLRRALDGSDWAIAVGADSPGTPPDYYRAARQALIGGAEAVIGPALDGGFYLIGLRRCPAGLFEGLTWSAATTCADMVARLVALDMAPTFIDPWYDVDEAEDLGRLRRHLALRQVSTPATAELLGAASATDGVSVIVPVYNEAARIGRTLTDLATVPNIAEVLVLDGQSGDDTLAIAKRAGLASPHPVRVVVGRKGRARQQNAGAALAQFDTLLFLHADVRLPTDAIAKVNATLSDASTVAGAFKTWTVPDPGVPPSVFAPFYHLADIRSRYTRFPYGDQAIFVRRAVFAQIGGIPDMVLMEDLAFSQRLAAEGHIARVDARVSVSARRLSHNWPLHVLIWNTFPTLFRLGVAPERLARWYRTIRG